MESCELTVAFLRRIKTRFPLTLKADIHWRDRHVRYGSTVSETTLTSPLHDDRRADLGAIIQVDDVIIGHADAA
jgi:hypothetical protein